MLQELVIDNFAIIAHLQLAFNEGMSVLSGETGAGKSIIIDAVGLLAGGRGSQEFIRTGSDKAILQGLFEINAENAGLIFDLNALGINFEDWQLIIQREMHRNGRNIIRVNGTLINLATLKKIGSWLVDIHGQNEHQELMQTEKHLGLLDAYGGSGIEQKIKEYQIIYAEYRVIKKQLVQQQSGEQQWAQRLDMLQFQVEELENANLDVNEEEVLLVERERLNNFQKISAALATANQCLTSSDNSVIDNLGRALQALQLVEHIDANLGELSTNLGNSYYTLQDLAQDVERESDLLEYDEQRLNEIEERLNLIQQLKRKYGTTVREILIYFEKIKVEYRKMQANTNSSEDISQKLGALQDKLKLKATELHVLRNKNSEKLVIEIHEQLKELYMDKAIFSVKFNETSQFTKNGTDNIEFYIQTNPGENAKPLAKVASGGELSRIMLALKTIFAKNQGITSIIFDEVDTGVSGRVAQAIAEKIAKIASYSQVLTITHLPQVAAIADNHFLIVKNVIDGRTKTRVNLLSAKDRIHELARMISGTTITELALANAQEMLKLSREIKVKL